MDPQASKALESTNASQASKVPKSTKAYKSTKVGKSTKVLKSTKVTKSTKITKSIKAPQASKSLVNTKTPEAPRTHHCRNFPQFKKLPLEIRRRIWILSFAPRVIRVNHWDTTTSNVYNSVYKLTAGPVPRLLHVDHESRAEGLRVFTLVSSHVSGHTSGNLALFDSPLTRKIFVDLEHDTFYVGQVRNFIKFFVWLRRFGHEKYGSAGNGVTKEIETKTILTSNLKSNGGNEVEIANDLVLQEELSGHKPKSYGLPKAVVSKTRIDTRVNDDPSSPRSSFNKSKAGNGIRNMAFSAKTLLAYFRSFFKYSNHSNHSNHPNYQGNISCFQSIAMLQPNISAVYVIFDNSKFCKTKTPQQYDFRNPLPYDEWKTGINTSGGHWYTGNKYMALFRALNDIWMKSSQFHDRTRTWKAWLADEERKNGPWKGPDIMICGLASLSKKVL